MSDGYAACPTCGDTSYRPVEQDTDVIECASCRTPLRKAWLDESHWTNERLNHNQ